jgi:hypothetical protein
MRSQTVAVNYSLEQHLITKIMNCLSRDFPANFLEKGVLQQSSR